MLPSTARRTASRRALAASWACPDDHHRHAQRRNRQVAVGAQLSAGTPPPHGRAAHDGRGKGVNIARTLKTLGQPVIATGFAGGTTGTHIVEKLTEESILHDFVRIRDESRTNTSVLDPTKGEQTEINERGPSVSEREVELFRDKLLYLARGAAIVVFAGSLPRDVEPDLYGGLIRDLERMNITTVLDTDGEPLRQGVRAEPDIVSPNVLEAE